MSLRCLAHKAWAHGRAVLRFWRSDHGLSGKIFTGGLRTEARRSSPVSGVQKHYEAARQLLARNILRRVTNPVSSELRNKTTQQLLYGNSTPFFAFVGISLASGSIISKEDELEGLCWEIRESVERMQDSLSKAESDLFQPGETVNLNSFIVGPLIGKGANAAVYAVRKTDQYDQDNNEAGPKFESNAKLSAFPFAIKMMFNFDAESNATSILRSMFRETIPARMHCISGDFIPWMQRMYDGLASLPPHPNVVAMHCAFIDSVPELPESFSEYPAALPRRINPEGYGRNKTLFLLMKRYNTTLKDYLSVNKVEGREAILIVTQLLEAVAHINRSGVAHRDLKSDNILVELGEDGSPKIALSDFGCALADKNTGLVVPFRSYDTDRGGNAALMAPEVSRAEPSLLSGLDYSKSDGWAAGAIAAEILLGWNPFVRCEKNPKPLQSSTYSERDLPQLPGPPILSVLSRALLAVNPSKRPSADFAANVLQLYLWSPSDWLKSQTPPSNSEVMQWLLCLTTKVLTTSSFGKRRSEAEYGLIGSFLGRIKLSSLKSSLSWLRALSFD